MYYETIQKIYAESFGANLKFDPSFTKDDVPTWDSIRYITFMVKLEKAFKMKFTHQAVAELKTIADIHDFIKAEKEKDAI